MSMIQPNELRLGNWVYDSEHTQFPMQVVGIGSDYVYLDFEGNEGDLWECDSKEIEPIPLTEELFKQIGFVKYAFHWDKGKIMMIEDGKSWVAHIEDLRSDDFINTNIAVKYLHELQNAYFIVTKQELEVKL